MCPYPLVELAIVNAPHRLAKRIIDTTVPAWFEEPFSAQWQTDPDPAVCVGLTEGDGTGDEIGEGVNEGARRHAVGLVTEPAEKPPSDELKGQDRPNANVNAEEDEVRDEKDQRLQEIAAMDPQPTEQHPGYQATEEDLFAQSPQENTEGGGDRGHPGDPYAGGIEDVGRYQVDGKRGEDPKGHKQYQRQNVCRSDSPRQSEPLSGGSWAQPGPASLHGKVDEGRNTHQDQLCHAARLSVEFARDPSHP